jgi:hypothetical protein
VYLACIPLGGVELHIVLSHFLLGYSKTFSLFPLFAFQVFNLVFAQASLYEILDVMSLRCESTGKKLETHVKEMEVEGTGTVYFLSQQPLHTKHNTSPKYKERKH